MIIEELETFYNTAKTMNQFYNNFFSYQSARFVKYALFYSENYKSFIDYDLHNQLIFFFKNDHQIYIFLLY